MWSRFAWFKPKYVLIYLAFAFVGCVLIVVWRYSVQHDQIEQEMYETTQVLATEMDAIWDFMERNQAQFIRNSDGTYNLYCVVAAKAVAKIFTQKSDDFIIHYTNMTTRKPEDAPDDFEQKALKALEVNTALKAYYELTSEDNGNTVFRYVEPLYYEESCLDCHGNPAGEADIMGYPKEGKQKGDLAGAASIIMPADTYISNMNNNIIWETVTFSVIMIVGLGVIIWLTSRITAARMHALEQDNKLKSDFLAMVSHEVRTPLTSILAFSDIWASSNEPRNSNEKKIMGEMRASSQVLLGIINNILEMARVEAGKMELDREPIDISDLVNLAIQNLHFLADKKGVTLSVDVQRSIPVILADSEKIRRICENLLSNAIKFSERGDTVSVYVSYDAFVGDLTICVRDMGIGIREEDIPHIFDRFVRGKSQADGVRVDAVSGGGSGLGLALVKELVDLNEGSISVESEEGKGSAFTVVIRAQTLESEDFDG